VHVYLPKTHPDAPSTSSHHSLSKLLVFETVSDGGFGNRLKLEEGALLELGRFESTHVPASSPETSPSPVQADASSSGDLVTNLPSAEAIAGRARRRFSHFHFRRRSQNRSISGPALAVVDAEPVVAQDGKPKDGKEDVEEGVRVTIRLAALDEQGTELVSPNEQITYLHIVRFGQQSTEVTEGGETTSDARPWVVKVVKREATVCSMYFNVSLRDTNISKKIGPHTFHLHEIFGLTASSSHHAPPTAPPPSETHTYPPDETQQTPVAQADDEDPQSECLLCLSSPREVVLLPCRHLVACKDCALNMVEFGAGGNITQATDTSAAGGDEVAPAVPAATAGGAAPAAATATAAPATAPATPAANQRRKRKAKGWFCPVCRQREFKLDRSSVVLKMVLYTAYTSMLRLTTALPSVSDSKDPEGSGTEDEGMPNPVHLPAGPTAEVRSGGLLSNAGILRPGFLRGLSLSRSQPADVENQAGARV